MHTAYSKRRNDETQPIWADLADLLRSWLAGKAPGTLVFTIPPMVVTADLEAAGIPYGDADIGFADFHSHRHSYISRLVRQRGVTKDTVDLARHSDPKLTMRYAHATIHDHQAALEALPAVSPEPEELRATGTTDGETFTKSEQHLGQRAIRPECHQAPSSDNTNEQDSSKILHASAKENPLSSKGYRHGMPINLIA